MALTIVLTLCYMAILATVSVLFGPVILLWAIGYLLATGLVGVAAGLRGPDTRYQRVLSWLAMSGLLVILASAGGMNAGGALRFGLVLGAISLLFWEPGRLLGDWLHRRRRIFA